jgi:poly(A) polymerase Pap1
MGPDDTLSPMNAEDSLRRAEELLTKVEQARARLETTDEPEAALDVLGELADLAKEVEAEIQRAKREAEAEADAER